MAILDHHMSKVLPDVNVPRTHSRPPMTLLYHSMHAVLSSYTAVGEGWAKPMLSRSSAVVFCIFDCRRIKDRLYRQRFPDVERRGKGTPKRLIFRLICPFSPPNCNFFFLVSEIPPRSQSDLGYGNVHSQRSPPWRRRDLPRKRLT